MGVKSIKPRVHILMVGQTLPAIRERFGDFDSWFQERSGINADFSVHRLLNGHTLPDPSDSDGWIITGSPGSVNDDLPWLRKVIDGVGRSVKDGHPILGVCFGHQLLAVATGGQVGLNPKGWELGSATIVLTDSGAESTLFQGLARRLSVFQSHQEVVTNLPPGAKILAVNEMGIQAFQINRFSFGVQFHPEFTQSIARMYAQLRSVAGISISQILPNNSYQVLPNFINSLTL